MEQTGAVIAAAGLSSRMGDFKPLLPFGEAGMAHHLVSVLKEAGVFPIVMITGYRAEELEASLCDFDITFIRNQYYASTEMLDSVKLGLKALQKSCCEVLVMPVDVPAVTPDTIRQLIAAKSPVVRTKCGSKRGHPVKLDAEMIEAVLSYEGEQGLKGFLKNREDQILDVELSDEGSFLDADTQEEYSRLLHLEGSRRQGYPDGESLRWMLETRRMPDLLRRHCEAVSRKALSMAVELQKTGRLLDLNLIRAASLLHDIGKGQPDHAAAGARFLEENGYRLASEIVRQHHRLDRIPDRADETLIVYLADKMIQGDKEVSIEERFEKSKEKCRNSEEARNSHQEKYLQAQKAWKIWEESFIS